ncbi:MAG: hypothetical protein ABIE84_03120 [bacterium]
MTQSKTLSVKEQTHLDSLKRALLQSPAKKIMTALKLSNLCKKLFSAANTKQK